MIGQFTVPDWRNLLAWIRDGIFPPSAGKWVDFTPTMTQSAALTISVTFARYCIIGKTVIVQMGLVIASAGTAGNNIKVASIPSVIAPKNFGNYVVAGGAVYLSAGVANYVLGAVFDTASTLWFYANAATAQFGANPAVTAKNTDLMNVQLAYEIAA